MDQRCDENSFARARQACHPKPNGGLHQASSKIFNAARGNAAAIYDGGEVQRVKYLCFKLP